MSHKTIKTSILIITLLYLGVPHLAITQSHLDSLQAEIRNSRDDSNKVKLMLELSSEYFSTAPPMAIKVAKDAEELGRKINYMKGAAYALKNSGIAYYYQGKYVDALQQWNHSLAVFDSISDKVGIANILSNIGAIYYDEGEYNKALDYYLRSLKVSEETGDTLRIVTALTNIGAVYTDRQGTHDKALDYLLRALTLSEKIEENDAIAVCSINIGEIFLERKDYDKALIYLNKALKATEATDGRIFTMISLAKVYKETGEHAKALNILNEALEMAREVNSRANIAHALVEKGNVFLGLDDSDNAVRYYKQAASIALQLNAPKDLEKIYGGLHQAYLLRLKFDSAYKYQQFLLNVKDTLYNIEMDKLLSNQLFNFQMEKKQNEINLLKKDQELRNLDLQKQKTIRNLVIAGFISVIIFLIVVVMQKKKITRERDRSDKLLLNILPYEVAEELKEYGKSDARDFNQVTVLFTDFVAFTELAEKLPAKDLVNEINYYFKAFDNIVAKHRIEKIKTIGDAYMAAGGLPVPNPNSVKNVVLAAIEMQEVVMAKRNNSDGNTLFTMRIGIHTGPVVAGIVGVKKFQYDIWGDTVNTASRMENSCEASRINISGSTYNYLKDDSEFEFEHRGLLEVKGKGKMDMYFVEKKHS